MTQIFSINFLKFIVFTEMKSSFSSNVNFFIAFAPQQFIVVKPEYATINKIVETFWSNRFLERFVEKNFAKNVRKNISI